MNLLSKSDFQTNMEQEYYNSLPVSNALKNNILNAENADAHGFEYVEVLFPDGKNCLCIKLPTTVGNGPGSKYKASPNEG